ncbi:ABC transporter substrate-binding protein [Litorihabitans aurantiacus]|uniref:Solute-binding protein family 5 domain-containing protein n=1 Tax=Litorihabitans aurantiacus TaxID=1930061 RepID=A0AA37XD09_9MICO|nr:hypothetical protein GCM10025875_03950 [Litorihabitans aurantiacus]
MNTTKPPFDDVLVRQAVFHALDRQELLDVAYSGQGRPLNGGYLPDDRFGALTEPVYGEPDLDTARDLLAEAGYPDGFETTITVIATSAFQVRQAEVEQEQLRAIGIEATIVPVESAVSTQIVADGDFELYQGGFGMRSDPDERFTAGFTTDGGLNYGGWSDAEFDQLIEDARGETDAEARAELYQEAEMILATRGPSAFTFLTADYDVVGADVMGYRGDQTPNFNIYKYLWLEPAS